MIHLAKILTLILLAAGVACLAEVSPAVSLSNGVQLRISTSFGDPNGQQVLTVAMMAATGNSFYRIFRDQNNLAVYVYELVVDRPAGGDEFHVLVRPAGDRFAQVSPGADGGKPVPTLSAPRELPSANPGAPLSFEVFEMPGTGEKVVDTISLHIDSAGSPSTGGLRFADLKIYMNKTLAAPAVPGITVAGRYAMVYIPGLGGFFFSAEPVAGKGFVAAGWVERTRMQFTLDNVTYDGGADAPILTQSDAGQLWVYHDPNYKPEGNWTKPLDDPSAASRPAGYFTAASNTLGWWIR